MAYTIQLLDITEVSLNDNNPRFIKDKSFKDLVKSLKECPALFDARPLLCNADRVILGGNMRYRAALELRYTEVPVIIMEGLTPEQEREIVIKDNGGFGSWDFEALANGWSDLPLDEWGVDLPEGWLAEPEEAPEEEEFNAEPPKEPITVLGDLYELNGHRLLCGDSASTDAIDNLLDGINPACIVTDPPYGIGIDGQKESINKNPKHNRKAHEFRGWDAERPDESIFNYIVALGVPTVIWGGNYFADLLPATRGWIYWSKGQDGLTMSDGELAWTTEATPLRCVTVNRGALQGSVHPTQKPLQVIEYSLDYLKAGQVALDLFGGSGTTMIACEKSNRASRLMELDPGYTDVIVRRWVKYMQDNNRPYTVKRNGQELSKAEIDQFFAE